jgi:hypothetical protein
MRELLVAVWVILFGLTSLVMLFARTGPDEATSNLFKWTTRLGLNRLAERLRPLWLDKTAFNYGLIAMGVLGVGLVIFLSSGYPPATIASNSVQSFDQKGGQTAHTIINNAPPSRLISPPVVQHVVENLRAVGSRSVTVSGQAGDTEIGQFAAQLTSILREGGWSVQGPNTVLGFSPITGTFIMVQAADKPPETARILYTILKRNGIDAPGISEPSLLPDQVVLFVGNRAD